MRIEIDTNGGVGGSVSQTVQKGTTVPVEAPTKEGYLFKGWKDDKGNSYPAGADGKVNITVNEDMKLTAVWEARTFTVTYVLLNGETRTEKVDYGQMVTLSEEPRTGYTFVGWKDGEKMYHAGETITVTGDMTLTAEWKKLPQRGKSAEDGRRKPRSALGRGAGGFRGGLLHAQTQKINQNKSGHAVNEPHVRFF